jgi:hypothetical protein
MTQYYIPEQWNPETHVRLSFLYYTGTYTIFENLFVIDATGKLQLGGCGLNF